MNDLINLSAEELAEAFCDESIVEQLRDCKILASEYETPPYEGYAFVLFENGGVLYEVNGSHCSCYGLEGQWEPTRTTWKALKMRKFNGKMLEMIDFHLNVN